jgi:hypothetical protein
MEMTPRRQALIDAHVAETRRRMADYAFQLNDLVRFALSAAQDKGHRVYYPMDPVNEGIRNWQALAAKVNRLAADLQRTTEHLGHPPFDPEGPPDADPPVAADGGA